MRSLPFASLLLLICLAATRASAGRIFGDITLDGKPAPAGILVKISRPLPASSSGPSPGAASVVAVTVADSTLTDKFGSYKLTVKGEGKCVLTIVHEKRAPTLVIFSYREATRFDLMLVNRDGTLFVERK